MADLWPWLAIAGLGALHGLNPATGWMFAAACGVHARDSMHARHALLPMAIGHVASIAIVVCSVAWGQFTDRTLIHSVAGALLIGVGLLRLLCGASRLTPGGVRASHAGIALWACLMGTAHGSGLMLVPALTPLCLGVGPARAFTASDSLVPALAAVGVHMAAMLVVTGAVASAVCHGIAMRPRRLSGSAAHQAWTATLVITGVLVLVLR